MRILATLFAVFLLLGSGCAQKGAVIKGLKMEKSSGKTWMIYDDDGGSGEALFWCIPPESSGAMPKCVKAQMVDISKTMPIVISPPAAKKDK